MMSDKEISWLQDVMAAGNVKLLKKHYPGFVLWLYSGKKYYGIEQREIDALVYSR